MSTAVSRLERQPITVHDDSPFANLLDTAKFEHLWRVSTAFAKSDLVPDQFRNKPENCLIGIQMAIRLGVDPFMFLQSSYVVHGRPGIEAKLAIGLANMSGRFIGPIRYKMEGEGRSRKCTAFAKVRETEEEIEMAVDWAMVEAEGWDKKSGSKWKTMPEIMFRYRAAMILIRTHCPEVILGLQSREELEDMQPTTINVPAPKSLDDVAARLRTNGNGGHAPADIIPPSTEEAIREEINRELELPTLQREPGDDLDPLDEEIRALRTLSSVGDVKARQNEIAGELSLNADELAKWNAACEARLAEIRAARSGGQQKLMETAPHA